MPIMPIMRSESPVGKQRDESNRQVIGITGGIGSGKSRVCSFLAEKYGFPLINLDSVCRDILQPQKAGWQALRDFLPDKYFRENGEIDRRHFRRQLFADSALRSRVDAVLHPLARRETEQRIAGVIAGPDADFDGPILVEIPLLFEAGWQGSVDLILVVYADISIRLQRIMQRDRVSEEQAKKAVAAQQCLREKAAAADYVIDNSGPWERTCSQIHELVGLGVFCMDFFRKKY
jgi:dephospho-CoA kinase